MTRTRSTSANDTGKKAAPEDPPEAPTTLPSIPAASSPSITAAGEGEAPPREREISDPVATPQPPSSVAPTGPPVNSSTFEYRRRTYDPIAKWPGSYAGADTLLSPGSDFATIREWMAEQRHGPLGPHQGRFYDEDDDLLALSSDDEDGITDAPSYVPIITVLGAPETRDPKERHAIYCAQCMVGVVDRYYRHGQREHSRYALQLARIHRSYDGSGPSRRVLRNLQRAQREGALTRWMTETSEHVMNTAYTIMTNHRPQDQSILIMFGRIRDALKRTIPFNGVIDSPDQIYIDPERFPEFPTPAPVQVRESFIPWKIPTESVVPGTQIPPSDTFTPMRELFTEERGMPSQRQTTSSSRSALSTVDLAHGESRASAGQVALTNIISESLPEPIKELNAKSIRTFLAAAEQYELRTGLRLGRQNIGGAEIRVAITFIWNDFFRETYGLGWENETLTWRTVLQQLLTRVGTDNPNVQYDHRNPFERLSHEWLEQWEFNPTASGQIYTVEASLAIKLEEMQLSEDQITRITPDIIKMLRDRVTFREITRLWGLERETTIKSEFLRKRFFPTRINDVSLTEWWKELREIGQQWSDSLMAWRKAAGITSADSRRVYEAEGAMLRALMASGKTREQPTSSGARSNAGRQHAQTEQSGEKPSKRARTNTGAESTAATTTPRDNQQKKQSSPRMISHEHCRYCQLAKFTEPGSHPANNCPRFPRGKGENIVAQHMLTIDRSLPVIDITLQDIGWTRTLAGKALLDSGANANFIHPKTLGECNAFNYTVSSTNTRLSLALNTMSVDQSNKESQNVANRSSSSFLSEISDVSKNHLIENSLNDQNTVRLLINHLQSDENKTSNSTSSPISLDKKVTIHLSITSSMGEPIRISCDAYVANIRYPIILGYPVLVQHDIFRRLPHIWSFNHQVEELGSRNSMESAERIQRARFTSNSSLVPATKNTGDWDGLAEAKWADVRKSQGGSATAELVRGVEPHTPVGLRHEAIDTSVDEWDAEEVDPTTHLCSSCRVEDESPQIMPGRNTTYDDDCIAALDEKPEQLFLAHHYHPDVMPTTKEVILSHTTIGTQESSDKTLNFTSRPIRDWEDIEDIDDDRLDAIPAEMLSKCNTDTRLKADQVDIRGPPSLKAKLHELVSEYDDIFSDSVNPTPASIEPFTMKVDRRAWQIPANGQGIRRMDKTRQDALKVQIDQMLKLGIIRESRAGYYSHGFLVPKKSNKWRLVIDYKGLNSVTERVGWPIPNIQDLLARIGAQKPKYFGVMDLTSGYHQAPIHESCIPYTAFLTPFGLYEWVRLPMGLAGAPSYFQRVMCTEVLAGLHAIICFLYLDDLIVTGRTEDEYINNMRRIFHRLREKNLTLNPAKCVLGAAEVEYVGHIINSSGIHFERSKLDSILEWEKPTTQKQLKRFLGVVNWFHGSVANHSTIVAPLNKLLKNYNKTAKIQWSEEATLAFEHIKSAVHECPTLFYMNDTSPIVMETDASQYGIGAILYQQISAERKHPVAIMSKAFDERMMRWDTAQKEGYAIFYALSKWEHLLRDRHFTIMTDHRNLRYLRETYGQSGKVQRWLACFQSFDFTLLHIKGEKNEVADGLSRCCTPPPGPDAMVLAHAMRIEEIQVPDEFWKQIKSVHNAYAGHFGVQRTMQTLVKNGKQWTNMREHIRKFIHFCPACQKMSQIKPLIHARAFTISSYRPMERIAIDYIHNITKDQQGHEHILVVIDCFTRFVELFPTTALTAEETADHLLKYVGRYGPPIQILSDNGSHFVNGTITALLHYMGIDHQFTIAYSKEENGIVERANKEVMRHLRNILFENGHADQWSRYIPLVQNIMNTAVHSATGFSPSQMVFGALSSTSRGLIYPQAIAPPERFSTTSYVQELFRAQQKLVAAAAASLQKRDTAHIARHVSQHISYGPITSFKVGQYVLIEYPNIMRSGPENKLLPTLKGPAKIIAKADNSRYKVEDLVTRRAKDYHISALRPYNMDLDLQRAPLFYAIRDHTDHFLVEKITAHKGKPSSKSRMTFQVHWVGYSEPTWEPWNKISRTLALYQYLKNHAIKALQKITPNLEVEDIVINDSTNSSNEIIDTQTITSADYLHDETLDI